jgi:hypothetical protein
MPQPDRELPMYPRPLLHDDEQPMLPNICYERSLFVSELPELGDLNAKAVDQIRTRTTIRRQIRHKAQRLLLITEKLSSDQRL